MENYNGYEKMDEKNVLDDKMYTDNLGIKNGNKSKKIGIICFFGIIIIAVIGSIILFNYNNKKSDKISEETNTFFGMIFNVFDMAFEGIDDIHDASDSMKEDIENFKEQQKQEQEDLDKKSEESRKEFEIESFNSYYEKKSGKESGFILTSVIEKVVTNNKKNSEHIVTVTYKGKTASTEQELVQMKYTLDEDTDYEVSIDYDSEGFVSNINIMTIDEVLNKQ